MALIALSIAVAACADDANDAGSATTTASATDVTPDAAPDTTAGDATETSETSKAAETTVDGSAPAEGSAPVDVEDEYTPAVMEVFTEPSWFTGSDGRVHLVYELVVTNGFPIPVTVTQVEVIDVDTDEVIETISGDAVAGSMSLLASPTEATAEIPGSSIGVVWFDVTFDDPAELPAEIEHEVTVSVPPGLPVPESISSIGGRATVTEEEPVVIAPPLEGDQWLAVGSCCDGPHRRSIQPVNGGLWLAQRFAIDFNRLSPDHLLATGDASVNESWPTYDQPVLAVADAEVVQAADAFPDQVPDAPEPVTIEEADGNYVILELDEGVYAFYAHLEPGSVAVQPGDTVAAGDVIGRTGNSGSSTGPHLHFQLMDQPSALVANGIPYEFAEFDVAGQSPPLDDLLESDPQTDPVPVDTATAGPRTDELPLGRDLVVFPAVTES